MDNVLNLTTILMNTFFAIFSAILGVVFSRSGNFERNGIQRNNQTQIIYIKEQIVYREVIYQKEKVERNRLSNNSNSSSSDGWDMLILLLFSVMVLVGLYVKFHSTILQILIAISIMIFIGSIAFAITLSVRNALDGLSRYWFTLSLIVTLFNTISIVLMNKQDLTMDHGIDDYGRIFYYIIGTLLIAIVNLIVIAIYLYIVSFNIFINWQNKVTYRVMKVFDSIFGNTKMVTIVLIIFIVFSLLMSSGILYELFSNVEYVPDLNELALP